METTETSDPINEKHSKIIIVGSGPAAHTAAIYAGRAFLHPILFEGFMAGGIAAGGQLTTTTDVENFPGFPDGIQGAELVERFRQQSINCGARVITETIVSINVRCRPFLLTTESGDYYSADAVIIATGATAKRLRIPGEEQFWQNGISACAVCDGPAPIFRKKPIAVIGGGDSASEEANFLTKYASHVYVLVRKDTLRASAIMAQRMKENKKITVMFNTVAEKALGKGKLLEAIHIRNLLSGEKSILQVSGLFYAIGHVPNISMIPSWRPRVTNESGSASSENAIDVDANGFIITKDGTTATNIPGIFACGDVQDSKYKQAITAAGSGCMAAMDAEKFLSEVVS